MSGFEPCELREPMACGILGASLLEATRLPMKILVTGTAGFIGSAVAERLLARGDEVIGVDEVNDYYDVALKRARLARSITADGYQRTSISISRIPSTHSHSSREESPNA